MTRLPAARGPCSSSVPQVSGRAALAIERTPAAAEAVVLSLLLFREWPQGPAGWSTQFMLDSEWNWLDGEPPIDDL